MARFMSCHVANDILGIGVSKVMSAQAGVDSPRHGYDLEISYTQPHKEAPPTLGGVDPVDRVSPTQCTRLGNSPNLHPPPYDLKRV